MGDCEWFGLVDGCTNRGDNDERSNARMGEGVSSYPQSCKRRPTCKCIVVPVLILEVVDQEQGHKRVGRVSVEDEDRREEASASVPAICRCYCCCFVVAMLL